MTYGQWLQFGEVVILAATLIITVLISWYVARQTSRHFRLERSQEFISRFNSTEMTATRQVVDDWLAGDEPPAELLDRYDSREVEATSVAENIALVANFFQELGVAFNHGAVDATYTWDLFGGLVRQYWTQLRPAVMEWRRRRDRPTLFVDFEHLAERMRQYDRRHGVDRQDDGDGKPGQTIYIFGYGSLINPSSASKTSSEPVSLRQMRAAWLNGYRRTWTVYAEARVGDDPAGPTLPMAFLNIEPDLGRRCNGVLLPAPASDLPRFDARERVYERVDVTDRITPTPDGRVYTYVGRSPYTDLPPETKIGSRYERIVREGAELWGESFAEAFEATTTPHDLPRVEGTFEIVGPDTVAAVRDGPYQPL